VSVAHPRGTLGGATHFKTFVESSPPDGFASLRAVTHAATYASEATRSMAQLVRRRFLALLAACESSQSPPTPPAPAPVVQAAPHELFVTIERTTCYGTCPAYTLSVYRDGVVEYNGEHRVKTKGPAIGRIGPEQLAALDRAFAEARYFELNTEYTAWCSTDGSTITTSYRQPNRYKRIERYTGACSAPPALQTLEDAIDTAAGTDRFIGTRDERERHSDEWY
jgi:hypothetical protein